RMPRMTRRRSLAAVALVALVATVLIQSPAMALPDTPTGLTPDGDDFTDNPVLHWNAVSGATSYRVQLSVSPSFSPTLYNTAARHTTSPPYNAIPTGTIYWRVAAIDGSGQGSYNDASFTRTLIGPGLFTPAADPGGAAPLALPGAPLRVPRETLSWANSYELQVDDAADFIGATIVKTDATSYTLPTTKTPGQNFFCRVRGGHRSGGRAVAIAR